MKRFFALFFASLTMLAAVPAQAAADVPEAETAQAYILIEASSGTALMEKNADMRLNAGYLAKLMTLLVVAQDMDEGKYSVSDELTASSSVSGTKGAVIWLETGDKMTVDELLKAVIIGNANDAVTVLAENSRGSVEEFVMAMNAAAFDLGLRDTAFFSPCGYYDEREYTTARDMARICAELAKYSLLQPYFKIWRDFIKSGKTELVSENSLTRTFDIHIGFKECHRDDLYFIAEGGMKEDGTCYIAVVMGAPDSDTAEKSAKKLINRGFGDHRSTATMFPNEMLRPLTVRGGVDTAVEIGIAEQKRLVIPKSVRELSTVVVIPEYITAPVTKGQRIGTAAFYSEKNLVWETDIVAAEDVAELTFGCVLKKIFTKIIE